MATWSITHKEPSTAPEASINSSTGVASFPANTSTTTDNVYTITYDAGNGCTASTTYTVKKKEETAESVISLYPQIISHSPEGVIYVNIDVSIQRGTDGLIEKYENAGYEIDVNVDSASGTRNLNGFSNGSSQLGCLDTNKVSSECRITTEEFLIGASDLFHGNIKLSENISEHIDSISPSDCEDTIISDINAQLPGCLSDKPSYEGNSTWRYNGNVYTLVWNYDIEWTSLRGYNIDLSSLPEELRNIITIQG